MVKALRRVILVAVLLVAAITALYPIVSPSLSSPSVIVFVGLEMTRADHIGPCYGYDRSTAPNLCGVAADGVLFEQAYAPGTWAASSTPSVLTGRTPREVAIDWYQNVSLSDNLTTFPEVLARHGYRVEGHIETSTFRDLGLLHGIDQMGYPILRWNPGENTFSFLYLDGTHSPHVPDKRFRLWDNVSMDEEQLRREAQPWNDFVRTTPTQTVLDLYDGDIRTVDQEWIGRMVEALKQEGMYRDALIVVFGTHGESFGQYGRDAGESGTPYEELVRVPLVVKFPGNRFAGLRVSEPVSLVDVPHTLLEYVGIDTPFGSVGSSLLPLVEKTDGERGGARVIREHGPVFSAFNPTSKWMVRDGNWTYFLSNAFGVCVGGVEPGQGEPWSERLYDLEEDPHQQNNIASEHPERVDTLRDTLCRIYNKGERDPAWFTQDEIGERMQRAALTG